VRQRWPAGALELQEPDRHLQLQRDDHGIEQLQDLRCERDDYINANAMPRQVEGYLEPVLPGYAADNVQSSCKDATTGATVNMQTTFLPYIAKMNYWMCEYARQRDSSAPITSPSSWAPTTIQWRRDDRLQCLRYVAGESESSYVTRITSTLRSTIRDANTHFVSSSSSYDTSSQTTSPDLHRPAPLKQPVWRYTGSGAPRYTSFTAARTDLEPVRSRAHGLGGVDI